MTSPIAPQVPQLAREEVLRHDLHDPAVLRSLFAASTPETDPEVGLRRATTRWLMADRTLENVRPALEQTRCTWRVLKGIAVGTHDYPARELRPIGDLDLLVEPERIDAVRESLLEQGWRTLNSSASDIPRELQRIDESTADDYLRRLGYCWQALREGHLLCEVHFRLWGSLPADAARDALRWSENVAPHEPEVPTLSPALRFVIAAAHAWMVPPPRPLHCWWDLEWIHLDETQAAEVIRICRSWGLQLPVLLAIETSLAKFGTVDRRAALSRELVRELRLTERLVRRAHRRHDEAAISQRFLNLARLLAGRSLRLARSRSGMIAAVWPHRFAIESRTPAHWSPAKRRLVGQLQHFRLLPRARRAASDTTASNDHLPNRATR